MDLDVTQKKRPLTLRDVSDAAGVSEMTVSRVLRNKVDVSAITRDRVLETTKKLGYVPNKIAGALASQRVNLVAVIIPSLSNMIFPEVMMGISDALDGTGLQPVVGVTNYSLKSEEKVLYEMLSWRPSGVIIAGLEQSSNSKVMLENCGIPVVQIMDIDGSPIDAAVGISHRRAGRKMAEAILKAGYENIGFMGTQMPLDHRARKRFEGFTQALAKRSVEIIDHEFYTGRSTLAKGREMTKAILTRSPDLDFIYYSNDLIGVGGLLHLRETEIDIPGQIGLAGFNQVELLEGLPQRLATMDSCRFEIGQLAANIVAARNDLHDGPVENVIELTPRISYGETLLRK
jgi:LacI family transcriptional regulator, gluconate utilization system Gnt-I transcriptional repressor